MCDSHVISYCLYKTLMTTDSTLCENIYIEELDAILHITPSVELILTTLADTGLPYLDESSDISRLPHLLYGLTLSLGPRYAV